MPCVFSHLVVCLVCCWGYRLSRAAESGPCTVFLLLRLHVVSLNGGLKATTEVFHRTPASFTPSRDRLPGTRSAQETRVMTIMTSPKEKGLGG